jgi:hypothetical protein
MVHIAVGFFDKEGRVRGEIAASRPGTEWVIPWLQSPDRKIKPQFVTIQTNGAGISAMDSAFEQAGIELVPWAAGDLGRASGITYDELAAAAPDPGDLEEDGSPRLPVITLTHGSQPVLDVAAATARVKKAGDTFLIDRINSPEDAAPLVAFVGVVWLMRAHAQAWRRSVYEDRGIRTI